MVRLLTSVVARVQKILAWPFIVAIRLLLGVVGYRRALTAIVALYAFFTHLLQRMYETVRKAIAALDV